MRNEIGNTYNRLTVISYDHTRKGHIYWKCICSCGCVTVVEAGNLRKGKTASCGCLNAEAVRERCATHGHSDKERLYNIWIGIRQRCNNENYKLYKWYGGKGVRMCEEWEDYSKFREWAFANGYTEPKGNESKGDLPSIDRIDPELDYSPSNCRWVSLRKNVSNMRKHNANQSRSGT